MTESSSPGWRTVYDDLVGQMDRGELRPGDQVPSERALETQHGVNRITVRRALDRLTSAGLITTIAGKRGRWVREYDRVEWVLTDLERFPRLDNVEEGYDDWAARMAALGKAPRQEVSVWIGPAPVKVARWLSLPPGGQVIGRHRLRYLNDHPWQMATSWFPWWLTQVPGGELLLAQRDVVVPGGMLEHIGYPQAGKRDELDIRLPTEEEIRALRLPPQVNPVGEHARMRQGADGQMLGVMVTIVPGDRTKIVYELDGWKPKGDPQ